jgi:putative ABC transport system permease protein
MTRTALSALMSHWRRHPLQLILMILGLALATALWTGVQAINAEARAAYAKAATVLGGEGVSRLEATTTPVTIEDFARLRRAGWPVSPVIEGRERNLGLRVLGVDPLTLPQTAAPAGMPGVGAGDLADFLAGKLGFAAPQTVGVAVPGVVLKPLPDLPPGLILVDIGLASQLLGMDQHISALLVDSAAGLPGPIPAGMVLKRGGSELGLSRLTDSFHLNLTAFGFLAFVVGIFIVHATAGLAFEHRRPVFRTLRAIGLSSRLLAVLVMVEMLILALIAGALGVGFGYLVAGALLPDVAATLDGLYGASVPGTLSLRPGWVLAGMGMAVVGTGVAAGGGLWQVWHLPPLETARPQAWAKARARMDRVQAGVGLALLAQAAGTLAFGHGLYAGFAVLAGLLLGAALVLPGALARALRFIAQRARPGLAQWFWADARAELPGLRLALMALLLALAANVGVGTMVGSFRATFTGWLDQRMAAELYLNAESPDQAARMQDWLEPRVDAVLPVTLVERDLLGQPGRIYGVVDHATYRDHWPMLEQVPGVWDLLHQGKGVLVNEQAARRSGLALGDPLALPGGALPVIGVYSDYGNPEPQAILGIATFQARFPEAKALRFALRLSPEAVAGLSADLTQTFDLLPDAISDQATIKAFSLQVFERTFAVTGALNVLTLAVAAVALLASLLTLSGLRLPGLAPVWALGVTQGRLAGLEIARSVVLALLTAVLALPLGLMLAWVLLAVVNVEAFGWRLPMQVFPMDLVWLFGMALATGALAAAWPAVQLYRRRPADLLRVFANAR